MTRGRLVALAAAAVVALLGEPAGASATGQARTVSIPVPLAGDMIVARIDLRTAGSGSAAPRLPKLRFLNAAGLPDEVTVVGGVTRDPKRRDRAIAVVVIIRPQAAAGTTGEASAVDVGFALWRPTLGGLVPVHIEYAADGSPSAGAASANLALCSTPRLRGTVATPGSRIPVAGDRAIALATAIAAACRGLADVPAQLAAVVGAGTPGAPPTPPPITCFGTFFPAPGTLQFGYRIGCPTKLDGFRLSAAGAQVTSAPAGCGLDDIGGNRIALACFPHDPFPPGATAEGTFGLSAEPTRMIAFASIDAVTQVQFEPVRQSSTGCSATWRSLGPAAGVTVELSCPSGARLSQLEVVVRGVTSDPDVTGVNGAIAHSCAVEPRAADLPRSHLLCSGYFLPGFFSLNTFRIELTLSGPAGSVQVIGQQADGAWEPFPVSPTGG